MLPCHGERDQNTTLDRCQRLMSPQSGCTGFRAEYSEIPDLDLSEQQAYRLWGLDPAMCRAVLDVLVRTGFLRRTAQGTYIRAGH